MNKQIVEDIKAAITERTGMTVTTREVRKNNGRIFTGLVVQSETDSGNVTPAFYIDELVDAVERGELSKDLAASYVIDWIETNDHNEQEFDMDKILSKENIKENVIPCLINTEKNAEMLKTYPHKDFMDLSVIYRVVIEQNDRGMCSLIVTNDIMETTGLSLEELDEAAMKNTEDDYHALGLLKLAAQMEGICLDNFPSDADDIPEVAYVLTNAHYKFGSSVMLHSKYLKEIADRLKSDLCVIPSSVHEVIVLDANAVDDVDGYKQFITGVNKEIIKDTEVLSDTMYKYVRATGELTIA